MASGVQCHEEIADLYLKKMQLGKPGKPDTIKFLTFKIENKKTIVHDLFGFADFVLVADHFMLVTVRFFGLT